ncbi:hypothetical protein LAZ29_19505 [Cereibacter sphaeroides]|uniref:hypothetical protein n=1 Tax=Cereibacter sphaeroides TaxID=1063 RepID=UPI001F45713D|nr:hypothetical protein [Cereibacter sphaeroides]MCE6953117.1 hypothetical protein [Cereibacter sphaeroides]
MFRNLPIDSLGAALALFLSVAVVEAGDAGMSCGGGAAAAAEPAERLCIAVQEAFRSMHGREMPRAEAGEPALFRLDVVEAGPTHLSARLVWRAAKGEQATPLLELSVFDRETIPEETLARFAETLISSAGPDLPDAIPAR